MNSKAIKFIENFSYTLMSNLVALMISTLITIVVPKLVGIEEYGYWQLYLFYSSYVGFLHFGWNDGIYLRYGGQDYYQLDRKLFFSQFYMLTLFQILIATIVFTVASTIIVDTNVQFIIQMTALCLAIVNIRCMLLYILQGTNRIKEYAQITMLDKILYCSLIIIFLSIGVRDYKLMIVADLIGKLISLLYAMNFCRNIVFSKNSAFYFDFREAFHNISVGIKLMFANIASMLIIGVVRIGIERAWDVKTFGKVSLTLSVSNLMMLFINAIGLIMFPILRRTDDDKLATIYIIMRDFLMVVLFGALIFYYPLKVFLSAWLPEYSDSLVFMALLFPICVYEGKMALLINTYLKTLRKEIVLLKMNLLSLFLSVLLTFFNTLILRNLNLTILSIVILLAFRSVISELYLSKILGISIYKDIILELILTFVFIFTGWFGESWSSVVIYSISFGIYLLIKKSDINKMFINLKLLVKS